MKDRRLIYTISGGLMLFIGILLLVLDVYFDGVTAEKVMNTVNETKLDLVGTLFERGKTFSKNILSTGYEDPVLVDLTAVSDDQLIEGIVNYRNAIEIPSLGIASQVNEGTDSEALHTGVGRLTSSSGIGEVGNCVIFGHASDVYNCIFNKLATIKVFDKIYTYDNRGNELIYTVTFINIVQPTDWSVTAYSGTDGKKELTLITCINNGQRRLAVKAELLTEEEVEKLRVYRRNQNLDTASKYNAGIKISQLYNYLTQPVGFANKQYFLTLKESSFDYELCRVNLYKPILGEAVVVKDHSNPSDFGISLGFELILVEEEVLEE